MKRIQNVLQYTQSRDLMRHKKVTKTFTQNFFKGKEKLKLNIYLKGKEKENTPYENKWETSKVVQEIRYTYRYTEYNCLYLYILSLFLKKELLKELLILMERNLKAKGNTRDQKKEINVDKIS